MIAIFLTGEQILCRVNTAHTEKTNSTYKLIIFDGDGVLFDTFDPLLRIVEGLVSKRGVTMPAREKVREYWGIVNWHEFYRMIGVKDTDALIKEFYLAEQSLEKFRTVPHARNVLDTLHKQDIPFYVVSWTMQESFDHKIKSMRLDDLITAPNSYTVADGKTQAIVEICKKHRMPPAQAVLVTDTYKDIIEGKIATVATMGIANDAHSFNPRYILARAKPTHIISDIREVLQYAEKRK